MRVHWPALDTYVDVRCRRCEGCRKVRQWSWMARAAHEQAFAKSTWFATLTFGPRRRSAIMAAASADKRELTPTERLVSAAGRYVQAYTKTLRKRGFEIRYIFVPELHLNGFPHFHGLVHDQLGTLHHRDLEAAWNAGFEVHRVVRDAKALRYVTKYLCKDVIGRVRASLNYGATDYDPSSPLAPEGPSSLIGSAPQCSPDAPTGGGA